MTNAEIPNDERMPTGGVLNPEYLDS